MDPVATSVYEVAALRAAEERALARLGLAPGALMERAGAAALAVLREGWPPARRVLVLAGPGNNGGDGLVLARLARTAGLSVTVCAPHLTAAAPSAEVPAGAEDRALPLTRERLDAADVVVDALFGIGLNRPPAAPFDAVIRAVNAAGRPVLSIDVPSGLDADTGDVRSIAVSASVTVAMLAASAGLYLGAGPDYAGRIEVATLGADATDFAGASPVLTRLGRHDVERALPRRPRRSHKGRNGHVVVIAGGPGMSGAARLAGLAALRAGAGLVTLVVHPQSVGAASLEPELIVHGSEHPDLAGLMASADVIAVGPGLGQSPWAEAQFAQALAAARPLVIDADALNLLAARTAPGDLPPAVLTPHPGEAARLLHTTTVAIEADRRGSVERIADRYGAVAVLKGAASLVAARGTVTAVCPAGNPGMAVAGLGDVLTGVIAAIAAQQPDRATGGVAMLLRAARAGVLVHALAGDRAAQGGERGLIATDVIGALRGAVNPIGPDRP